ncbi:hypothetical protein ABU16_1562 [Bacillus subtilis]|nr:hypothetical protein ABU16_1562 [Bacillus subtilis]
MDVSELPIDVWSFTSGSFKKFSITDSVGDVSPKEELVP